MAVVYGQCVLVLTVCAVLVAAKLDPDGVKCGDKRCGAAEYCSPFDTQCRPCSIICDVGSHNRNPETCVQDCQDYLHDQRYVLRSDVAYDKREIQRLKSMVTALLTVVCLLIIGIIIFVSTYFIKWKQAKSIISKTWRKHQWFKKPKSGNKVQQVDVETANVKQPNGLRITMPTISGVVVAQSPNSSCKDSSCNGNATPSTSSTTLSRKIPSEDSTVEYAYDNPAMTPSPEVTQLRSKRESSF